MTEPLEVESPVQADENDIKEEKLRASQTKREAVSEVADLRKRLTRLEKLYEKSLRTGETDRAAEIGEQVKETKEDLVEAKADLSMIESFSRGLWGF